MGRETCVTQVASSFKTSISSGPRSCLLIQSSKHLMPQVSHLLWDSGPHLRAATSGSSLPFNIARRYLHATMLSVLSWLAIFSVINRRFYKGNWLKFGLSFQSLNFGKEFTNCTTPSFI